MDSDYEQESEEIVGVVIDSSDDDDDDSHDDIEDFWQAVVPDNNYHYNNEWYNENLRYPSERIFVIEQTFLDSDKESGNYYIGSATLIRNRYYIMNAAITANSFFQFPINSILFYLNEVGLVYFIKPRIDIMRLFIHPVTMEYIVVLKTFWISIIQRTWRRILRERKEVLRKRCSIQNIQHRMIHGRHLMGLNILPGLVGCLDSRKSVTY